MQRNIECLVLLLMLSGMQLTIAKWLKRYEENYHRPHYYNRAHKLDMHVDYNRKILEGRDIRTKPGAVPLPEFDPHVHKGYYVNILHKASVICGGALISHRMVMTSSRCFMQKFNDPTSETKAKHLTVVTGNDIGKEHANAFRVIALFLPSSRDDSSQVHDVALLGLEEKLDKFKYRYIKLFSRMPIQGTPVEQAQLVPETREIELFKTKVVPLTSCQEEYGKNKYTRVPFDEAEFYCVRNRRKYCSSRPGDPAIIERQLAGINIYGEHCDDFDTTGVDDVYFAIRHTIPFVQRATDLLRAFTGTGPFNNSMTTPRSQLFPDGN